MVVDMQNKAISKYSKVLNKMTKLSFPDLTQQDIDKAVQYSINKRFKEHPVEIHNNYTKKTTNMMLDELTNYILSKEPICASSGVMFKKHGTVPNPLIKMIKMFMDNRGIHKKEMFKYEKGSEMFEKYNLFQLLDKIDCRFI